MHPAESDCEEVPQICNLIKTWYVGRPPENSTMMPQYVHNNRNKKREVVSQMAIQQVAARFLTLRWALAIGHGWWRLIIIFVFDVTSDS